MKKIKKFITYALIIAIAFYLGSVKNSLFTNPSRYKISSSGFGLKLPGEVEKSTVTINEIKSKLSEIGETVTCQSEYEITRGREYIRYFFEDIPILGTKNEIQLNCKGIIKAGYKTENIDTTVDPLRKVKRKF